MKTRINIKSLQIKMGQNGTSNSLLKLVLFSLFLFSLNGFTQSFQWGVSGGGINGMSVYDSEQINEIVTDGLGNVYGITPVSNNGLVINGAFKPDFQGPGAGDISRRSALVSYGCDGAFRWSKIISSELGSKINAVKIDSNNNVYISGSTSFQRITYFDDVVSPPYASPPCGYTFANGIYTYQGCKEFFIAKYDTNGNLLWIIYPEGINSANINNNADRFNTGRGYILDIDENNNLYMMCSLCEGTFCNGAYTNNVSGENVYGINDATVSRHILKFNSDGQFIDGYPFNNMPIERYNFSNQKAFRSKNTGNIYFIGYVASNITTFAMVNGEPITKPKNVFAFNAQGQFLWRVESNYAYSNYISDLVVDENENIYVSALAQGTKPNEPIYESFAGFTPYVDANCFTSSLSFIVKLNEQGIGLFGKNPQFEDSSIKKRITYSGNELLLGISILNLKWGNQNFVGTNYYGAGIVRLNKNNGALLHIEQIPNSPTQGSYNTSITSDYLGNYYIGGGISDAVTVGSNNLISNGGNTDFIIAKFGTDNCNCQVPTCRFAEVGTANNTVQFTYQGQDVYDSLSWNFGDMTATSNEVNPLHSYTAPGVYNVCVTATNSCDTFQFCKLVDTNALSTSGFVEDFSVNMEISPNPAHNFANITFNTALTNPTFEIYDVAGRLVQHYEPSVLNGKISLPISNMQTGMYVVILKQNGVMKMQKKLLVE